MHRSLLKKRCMASNFSFGEGRIYEKSKVCDAVIGLKKKKTF